MAHHLTRLSRLAMALIALGGGLAQAQALADPTLVPPGLGTLGGDAGSGNPLQSIILSGDRKLAVIGGRAVALGGMYGDAKLVAISPTQVTLRRGNSTEVLKLYEGIEKRPSGTMSRVTTHSAAGVQK